MKDPHENAAKRGKRVEKMDDINSEKQWGFHQFHKIFDSERMPEEWRRSALVPFMRITVALRAAVTTET